MIWAFELRVMQSDRSAHWRRLLVAATAAVSCATTVAFAQVATESAERANAQGATSEAIEPAQSAQPTTDTATDPSTDPSTDTDSNSVVEYEPSESISEDLSVSFPVDI